MPVNGLAVMTPTSIVASGGSASINADGSVTFSSCTGLSLNGIFNSSYDNYMLSMRHSCVTGGASILGRMRVSNTDDANANYMNQYIHAFSTTIQGDRQSSFNAFRVGVTGNVLRNGDICYFFGPFLTQPTAARHVNVWGVDSGRIFDTAGTHSLSVSYTGLTLLPENAFSGLLTVFGFNQ